MRARKARDSAYKGDDELDWKALKQAFTDPFIPLASLLLSRSRYVYGSM